MILFWYQNKDSSLFKNIESMAWSAKKTFLELLLRNIKLPLKEITINDIFSLRVIYTKLMLQTWEEGILMH